MDQWNNKVDSPLIIILLMLSCLWVYKTRLSENIGSIDLTQAELSCEENLKTHKFHGFFHLNNEKYGLKGLFYSCEDFKELVRDKRLNARHLKINNLIIDFYINYKEYYKESITDSIFPILLLTVIGWVIIRIPILLFIEKYT